MTTTNTECNERYVGALAWSKLAPKPLLVYDTLTREYMVCWHGYVVPRLAALSIAAKHFLNIYPGPAIMERLSSMYGDKKTPVIIRFENQVAPAILELRNNLEDHKDVLRWFDKRNAMEI